MDCATIRSDVIGDFQEPYGAVLVEGDDMAALSPTAFESDAEFRAEEGPLLILDRPTGGKCHHGFDEQMFGAE